MTVLSRHAVVIIHGIGEQIPLETVRQFVGRRTVRAKLVHEDVGVVTDADRVFSEPSPIGGRTDDRAYLVTWNHTEVADRIRGLDDGWAPQERSAMTDFYEFYWAPRYRTTSVGQLTGWLTPILKRRRNSFSSPRLVAPAPRSRAQPQPGSTRRRNSRVRASRGALKISAGGPCSRIRPWSRKHTLVATSRANAISWVARSMVIPASASARTISSTSPTSSGSRAAVISSSSSSRGCVHSARTTAARCC